MNIKAIQTWLPVYSGNYGTVWDDAPNEEVKEAYESCFGEDFDKIIYDNK